MTENSSTNPEVSVQVFTAGRSVLTRSLFRRGTQNLVSYLGCLFGALFLFACATTPDMEDQKRAEAHNKLGYSYLNNGQFNEAFVEFQKALTLNPENKETLNYLGYISDKFQKYDDAITYYKRALSIDPNYADVINNLGSIYGKTGDWDEAIKHFQGALNNPVYQTPAWAYSNMGYAYYRKRDYENAQKALNEALVRNPVFPRAMYFLGLVYVELDNDSAAIEEFKKAVGIKPDDVDIHWELAKAYHRTGKKAKALKHFKVVAENDKNVERSREASTFIEELKY